jgi:hypothetical protein
MRAIQQALRASLIGLPSEALIGVQNVLFERVACTHWRFADVSLINRKPRDRPQAALTGASDGFITSRILVLAKTVSEPLTRIMLRGRG